MTDTQKKVIEINKKKSKATGNPGELLDTLKHEILGHAEHPRMSERQIYKRTARLKISQKMKNKLYSLVRNK